MRLNEVITEIRKLMPETEQKKLVETHFDDLIGYHHGFGTSIRNHFKMWEDGGTDEVVEDILKEYPNLVEEEYNYIQDRNDPNFASSIYHPDQASFAVIQVLWITVKGAKIVK